MVINIAEWKRQRKSDCPIVSLLTAQWTEVLWLVSEVCGSEGNKHPTSYLHLAPACLSVSAKGCLCKPTVTHSPNSSLENSLYKAACMTLSETFWPVSHRASWLTGHSACRGRDHQVHARPLWHTCHLQQDHLIMLCVYVFVRSRKWCWVSHCGPLFWAWHCSCWVLTVDI